VTREERAVLLRKRFRAVGGIPFPKSEKSRQAKPERPKPTIVLMRWPDIIVDDKRTPQWMKDESPQAPDCLRVKRTARVSALTKIAEQLPYKLPRVPLPQ
jgi:hypothetical protein